ncbi:hypothetical protein QYE76_037047 [Lolium multiflorum]|uniref:Reverse transcriptase domain-containing protein n=1 Tax=Lolium multiflorum TaxID=4521 RepID=A0AAD8R4R0_LOLMU|nr:hypothetical protein QYE76_037047 [Lolium multiflorum]
MTFGSFHFRVGKEGSHRLAVPNSLGPSAIDSNFSGSSSSFESGDEEISPSSFTKPTSSGKLADIFGSMSFGSYADSDLSSDSESVDNFDFIDISTSIREVFADLYDNVTDPEEEDKATIYHQVCAIGDSSRQEDETSEAFNDLGNPYSDPADLTRGLGNKYVRPTPRQKLQLPQAAWDRASRAMNGTEPMTTTATAEELQAYKYKLSRFHGIIPTRPAYPLGKISLDVVFGTPSNFRKEKLEFEVVDWESQYHAILGRPAFAKFMAIPHYAYRKLKMPGNNGTTITVHGSFSRSDSCDRDFQKIASKFGIKEELNALDVVTDHTKPPADNRNESALIKFLRECWEIFAWEPSGMLGIPRELAEHALNLDPKAKPVQQTMCRFSEPKRKAIGEEVNRLRKAGLIRELKDSEWVANPVMKDSAPPPSRNSTRDKSLLGTRDGEVPPAISINATASIMLRCDRLSFLDAYSGYNQIKLKKEDQELTAFITPHGVFCYNVMTFGLKNAGATYQRCMQACLGEQMGRNIEVYIDDIVVKTKHAATLIDDLWETFDNLDRYKIKLNPNKCFFGVPGGQVLGYFISARGIEANPLKIKAILDMEPPNNLHQVQQLAGRLAALSRFIAKLGEKALPFYQLMKKSENFEWTEKHRNPSII